MHFASLRDNISYLLGKINIPGLELGHTRGIEIKQTHSNQNFRRMQYHGRVVYPQCSLGNNATGLNYTMEAVVH